MTRTNPNESSSDTPALKQLYTNPSDLERLLRPGEASDNTQSPYRLLILLTMTVFITELIIMFVIEFVFNNSTDIQESVLEASLDASVLTLIVFPVLYYFSFKPLLNYIRQHAQAEQALHNSYLLLESSFASLADAVFVLKMPERTVSICNRAVAQIFGYSQTDFRHSPLRPIFLDEASYQAFLAEVDVRLAGQDVFITEIQTQSRDGRILYTDVTVTEIKDEYGRTHSQVIVCRDITSRRYAEQQLRLQTAALEAAANGVMITNTEGVIEWVNPAFTQMTQYTLNEARGASANILVSGAHNQAFFERLWQTIKAGQVWNGEIINRRKDGTLYDEAQSIAPVRDNNGDITHFVAIKQDISERKEAEIALRESEERYRSLIETSPDGILLTDLSSKILFCNQQAARLAGYTISRELVGQSALELVSDDDRDRARQNFQRRLTGENPDVTAEYMFYRQDGTLFPAEVSASVLYDTHNKPVGLTAVARDITERKIVAFRLERHNHELQVLNHLGQNVVSSLDTQTIFNQVIDKIMPLLDAECFSILLLQDDYLFHAATGGRFATEMKQEQPSIHNPLYQKVIADRTPCLITSHSHPQLETKIQASCACQPTTLLMAPILVNNKVIGLTQASHTQPDYFTEDDLQLLQAATNWAAIAISHASQHKEIRRRLQEAATLAAINHSLNETLDLDNILQLIADSIPRLIPKVERVVIHLLQHDENLLYPAIWSGEDTNDAPLLLMRVDEGIAGKALQAGRLINVPDVHKDTRYLPHPHSPTFASLMVAPLQSGRQQLGTISVHNFNQNAFSHDDERLLARLADSAAVTIATADLYQAERNQRQLSDALAQAARALNVSLQLDDVLDTILQQARHILNCDHAAIYLMRGERPFMARTSDNNDNPHALPLPLERLIAADANDILPPLQLVIETGKPVLITETRQEPFWPHEPELASLRSFAAVPLGVGKNVLGFLTVHDARPGAFGKETIGRLEALAAHASLAVQNAHLYTDLKASLRKEKSTRAQLVQAQKLSAMGRMVASVAHELNNPLQTIKNCIFLSQQVLEEDAEVNTYLDMALSETKRLTNLVLQLRDVYRPDDKTPIQPIELASVVNEVSLILRQHLEQHHVTYDIKSLPEDTFVTANGPQLKQVFLNICLNAIEAMQPDGGSLFINAVMDEANELVGIEIQDTGAGISSENKGKLFEPFFTTKETGTGLGLAICYDIVQKHGGHITVDSEPGQGATFTVWLPLITAVSPAA